MLVQDQTDAQLVAAASGEAFAELFRRWFDRSFDVARNVVRNDDSAAEVAQEVFLNAWNKLDQLEDPHKFGGWVLRSSRNRALNRLEKDRKMRPKDSMTMAGLHDKSHFHQGRSDLAGSNRELEPAAVSERRATQELVWAATAALGERDASLIDLVLRHGLTPAEIADELQVSANNAHQILHRLRSKVGDAVVNYQLWRQGSPSCPELKQLLVPGGFDKATSKQVQAHSKDCSDCLAERRRVVEPHRLLAAVPIVVCPPALKVEAAGALAAEGVSLGKPGEFAEASSSRQKHQVETEPAGLKRDPGEGSGSSANSKWKRLLVPAACVGVILAALSVYLLNTDGQEPLQVALPEVTVATTLATVTLSTDGTTAQAEGPPERTEPVLQFPAASDRTPAPTGAAESRQQPPNIIRFFVARPVGVSVLCQEASAKAYRAGWLVENADKGLLTVETAESQSFAVAPSGDQIFCAPAGTLVSLEVSAGEASVSAEAITR